MDKQHDLISSDDTLKKLLKKDKTFRIAVSGDVQVTELERLIIDTEEFQRLRRIKQLCTVYLVYPSAIHTRYEHSLGTLSEVDNIISKIRNNDHLKDADEKEISPAQEIIVRLVALLHDIANIPFGHTLEDEMCVVSDSQDGKGRLKTFLEKDRPIGKLICEKAGEEIYKRFYNIITCKKEMVIDLGDDAFIYDMVKNTACADLFDYIKRDFYFCNLPLSTGVRFQSYMHLRSVPQEQETKVAGVKPVNERKTAKRIVTRLCNPTGRQKPKQAILSELLQLLEARYLLGERVYFHHAKMVSSAMIGKAVWLESLVNKDIKRALCNIGDEELIELLLKSNDESVQTLAKSIKHRKLLKIRSSLNRKGLGEQRVNQIEEDFHKNAKKRTNLESNIASIIGRKAHEVVIYCPEAKMNMKIAEMLVDWNGEVKAFHEIGGSGYDSLIGDKATGIIDSHKGLWNVFLALPDDLDDTSVAIASSWFGDIMTHGEPQQHTSTAVLHKAMMEINPKIDVNVAEKLVIDLTSSVSKLYAAFDAKKPIYERIKELVDERTNGRLR